MIPKPKHKPNYHARLWKLVSEYVRRAAQGKCYTCGTVKSWKQMDAGHFYDKSICGAELYFSLKNLKCQCDSCNRFKSGNKAIYAQKLVADYGCGILDELATIKQTVRKWDDERYIKEIAKFKVLLAGLE